RSRQDSAREQRSVALGWIATDSPPAYFCLVCNKIMLENPHIFLVKTGSEFLSTDPYRFAIVKSYGKPVFLYILHSSKNPI
ncbi:hypothetical protein, partial [Ruminococcus sp.]|uniref:hypothetical protein n=1 Tax=Ruminococcus sp. TaxID=41978 RepID=UPI002E76008F